MYLHLYVVHGLLELSKGYILYNCGVGTATIRDQSVFVVSEDSAHSQEPP